MFETLPSDCISKVLEFWSPMNAHEQKVFIRLNKLRLQLMAFMKENTWGNWVSKEQYKHLKYDDYKPYITLWNLIVKSYDVDHTYTYHGVTRSNPITLTKLRMTTMKLIIPETHVFQNGHQHTFNSNYMVDAVDFREVAKNYKTNENLSFDEDIKERKKISTKMKRQDETKNKFIKHVIEPLIDTVNNYMFNSDKRYLYTHLST